MNDLKPSEQVAAALRWGASPACDGLAAVDWFRFKHRRRDPGPYRVLNVRAGDRHIQVTISPTGRSVQVYVDGQQVKEGGRR